MGNLARIAREIAKVGPHSEERTLRGGELDMRAVINHAHRHMRFMDFRVGNYDRKLELLVEMGFRAGIRKLFTIVEKQDSSAWRQIGFIREGVYPGFFRTADAYVMSMLLDDSGQPEKVTPLRSSSDEQTKFPQRKLKKPSGLTVSTIVDEASRTDLVTRLNGHLCALPFAAARAPELVLHAKAQRREGWAVAEVDDSFAHATISFAPRPLDDNGLIFNAYTANELVSVLVERELNNVFGLAPMQDRWLNELFSGLGFRVTGRLHDHLQQGDGLTNALLWHRRIRTT